MTLKHSGRGSSPVSDDEHYKIKKLSVLYTGLPPVLGWVVRLGAIANYYLLRLLPINSAIAFKARHKRHRPQPKSGRQATRIGKSAGQKGGGLITTKTA